MPKRSSEEPEPWTQLATRLPKGLLREVKLHCVTADVLVMDFVVTAIREKLAREVARQERKRAK